MGTKSGYNGLGRICVHVSVCAAGDELSQMSEQQALEWRHATKLRDLC